MPKIYALSAILAAAALSACNAIAQTKTETLVVHEWGTFTSFQDNLGATIRGINVDDEPVPEFVHRLKGLEIFSLKTYPAIWSQGAPRCNAEVTLRLETPVVYFYPPANARAAEPIDFRASFRGGWLTEYFPAALADNPGFPDRLAGTTRGRLEWKGLRLGAKTAATPPQTAERVWLAPRKVKSATLTTADGAEAEKYLFYRGVGHIDAPLVVQQRENRVGVALRAGRAGGALSDLPTSWLVRVLPDGRVWYSAFAAKDAVAGKVAIALPAREAEASHGALDALRAELRAALVAQGLFPDEAQAMLETWELSYFKSEGLRLFFLLPRAWTDYTLPISLSARADITRVMMGRIELISPHQQRKLAQLYELPASELERKPVYVEVAEEESKVPEKERAAWQRKFAAMLTWNRHSHAEFYEAYGREVPEGLKLYDSLGRFRDALLAHELSLEKDGARKDRLAKFIAQFSACVPSR
jgi:hypothetical protein